MECKELIIDYIGRELRQVALKILPKKQVKYLSTSQSNLLEYVYVIEKYLSTRVLPVKYDVFYSSKVKKQDKYIENKNRIDTFVSYLKDADLRINSPSENYLPRSYKTFLSANPNQSDKYRYNPDVLNDYYGIRHAHLKNAECDDLLFYVLANTNAYILNVGAHNDFFNETCLNILVNEFNSLLNYLEIMCLDIHPGEQSYEDTIREQWKRGVNESFIVNGKRYIGMPMTLSKLNYKLIRIVQNIYYQVDSGLKQIREEQNKRKILPSDQKMIILENETKLDKNNGIIYLNNPSNSFRVALTVHYLKKLYLVECVINTNVSI